MSTITTPEVNENEILMENVRPIKELRLSANPGTITVLSGPNGVGKTHALDAIDSLASGKTRLENRDGTTGGIIQGFGITIRVGRGGRNRRSGDLEIESVEDNLDIAQLVDPGLKDPIAADARRIKALVTLSGVEANPELFYDLVGGKEAFLAVVKPASLEIPKSDIVEMASDVKRDFEKASRDEAAVAENLAGEIRVREVANEGIDVDVPHDAVVLQDELGDAIGELATEKQRVVNVEATLKAARISRQRIEASKAEYEGLTVGEADEAATVAEKFFDEAYDAVSVLVGKLTQAKSELQNKEHTLDLAQSARIRAQEHSDSIARWEEDVKAAENIDPPMNSTIELLNFTVVKSRLAIETGVRVRDALERNQQAKLLSEQMKLASTNSERWRDAAHGTEDILSRLVAEMGGVFKVDREFRLVVQHARRGETYYAELSMGERCAIAIGVVIEAFKKKGVRGLLALPQELWESLDADNRRIVANRIKGTDLAVWTAEVSREEKGDALLRIARELKETMQCNCDLDTWEPEIETGHSHVCRIHIAAKKRIAEIVVSTFE